MSKATLAVIYKPGKEQGTLCFVRPKTTQTRWERTQSRMFDLRQNGCILLRISFVHVRNRSWQRVHNCDANTAGGVEAEVDVRATSTGPINMYGSYKTHDKD